MRRQRHLLAIVALAAVTSCGAPTDVRSTRADPVSGSGVPSTGPNDSTQPNDTTETTVAENRGTLTWGPCDDPSAEDPSLECTTLTVPLDYANPSGDTVDLALVRVPAVSDRRGAVLFNPGGPGASGFDFIAQGGTSITPALGLDSFDLVGFDPRGVDRSGGIRCVTDEFRDQHLYVDNTPDTPEEQALKDEADSGFVDACVQTYGDTLRFYSTASTARDMDAIREALGDDQISFLGGSYGTYLGATYATLFPDRVRAMALDSAYEPNGDTVEEQYKTQIVGFEGAFNNWAAWCQGEPTCPFTATDVGARWDALKLQLDTTPIPASDGRLGNNATMERATTAALYSETDWPVLAKALADAENGDPAGIFALADDYNGRNEDGTFSTLFQSLPVIECASGIEAKPPDDPEALAAILRAAAPRRGKDITADDLISGTDDCNKLVGEAKPVELDYAGEGPIVVIGGANDPATPIRWAEEMTAELGPNARMVTNTGEGHGQLLVNTCVTDVEAAVLVDLKLPDAGTVCDPDPIVEKPEWWDGLPVPAGMSDVVSLPVLATALGIDPTQLFGEARTTSLSADDAVAAYTDALKLKGFETLDIPQSLPFDDAAQAFYTDSTNGKTLIIVAVGPKAFEDEALQSAKNEVPPNMTVVWLVAG
jgi:pimeloyl-ACP methyl ester carboxylesterase